MYRTNLSHAARAKGISSKIGSALADAWMGGNRDSVRSTIDCGTTAEMRREWKDATAEALPADARQAFLDFMRQ